VKRVIVSGTREILGAEDISRLELLVDMWAGHSDEIGVGDCPTGVDAVVRLHFRGRVFRADWQTHGAAAGPRRNAEMVAWAAEADEALLIAMPAPSSRGTWDTINRAVAAGIPVVIVPVGGKRWPE